MTIEELVSENERRAAELHAPFNPVTGEGSPGRRREVFIPDLYPHHMRLPVANPPEMISMTVDWKKEYAGDIVMEGKEAQTE